MPTSSLSTRIWCALAAVCLIGLSQPNRAQDGALDPSFDSDGVLLGGPFTGTGPIAGPQSDGKWVIASQVAVGAIDFGVEVIRVDASGALDPTFGSGGTRIVSFPDYADPKGFGGGGSLFDLDILPDNSIIVTALGERFDAKSFALTADIVVAKLDAAGDIDPGFGDSGYAVAPFTSLVDGGGGDRYVFPWALKAAADGSLFVVGFAFSDRDFIMAKFTASGALDASFGAGGELYLDSVVDSTYTDLILLDDGRIVASGGEGEAGVDRLPTARVLLANGDPDTSISPDGVIQLGGELPGYLTQILEQPDGGFLLVGYTGLLDTSRGDDIRKMFVRRLAPDLTVDNCFGVTHHNATNPGWRLQPQGAGVAPGNSNPVIVLVEILPDPDSSASLQQRGKLLRINQGGGRDASFGTGGVVDLIFDPAYENQLAYRDPTWHSSAFVTSLYLRDTDDIEDPTAAVMRFLDGDGVFGDGFETGDLLAWGEGCRAAPR